MRGKVGEGEGGGVKRMRSSVSSDRFVYLLLLTLH